MTTVHPHTLRAARSTNGAVELLRLLGYDARALPFAAEAVGLDGAHCHRLTSDRSPARGYGVLVAELDRPPRSLRTLGRRLVEQFHDRPLAILGVRNGADEWGELIVLRPRLIEGGGGAVSVRKLTIDVERPTRPRRRGRQRSPWHGGRSPWLAGSDRRSARRRARHQAVLRRA